MLAKLPQLPDLYLPFFPQFLSLVDLRPGVLYRRFRLRQQFPQPRRATRRQFREPRVAFLDQRHQRRQLRLIRVRRPG